MYKAILFDLDGKLLPLSMDNFRKVYFPLLVKKGVEMGIDKDKMKTAVLGGLKAMVENDGTKPNCDVFWDFFQTVTGVQKSAVEKDFEYFYNNEFLQLKEVCGDTVFSRKIVDTLKQKGYRLILATNPILPVCAAINRMAFVGLKPDDFEYITGFENSTYCKPNVNYYSEILQKNNLTPQECLMVGNNALEDMVANKLGIDTFLVTDVLENDFNLDYSNYENGSLEDFYKKVLMF